ncbi:tyrosine--tRNA ligase [Rhodococcus antarcticus]|uniref:Tyrosine--tRNA ligase n=1 Tax=Rhodococcus antarcticus TaxID=2987751 RepID=A0ABY6NVN2_9NOCA|nr:tyrosine--tRNA ligase [Rhodococcus antarcticus]UZJ23358.1 tyrosine--tRNA ligase [Rhodococcus antarcticus]
MPDHILDELTWRGLLAHTTDPDALREELDAGPITLYCGFDPTAASLHVGNLLQLLTVRRLQLAGHRPLALVGGSTGMIGDPKETGERTLNSAEVVAGWVSRIQAQVARFLDFDGPHAATMVNNLDWTAGLSTLDFLRDVGKHFPVNRMLDRQVVSTRLEAGISYTEFSYVLLQSMDYLELHRRHGCVLQTGGSDQWGNITAGVELVRRADGVRVHALATPLVTRADGTKFGKTEAGTVWLDPDMTSPYAFFQFWVNAEDSKVGEYLRLFTFLDRAVLAELEQETAERPQARGAQRTLAREVTTLVHGAEQARAAELAAGALFGRGDLEELDETTLRSALTEASLVRVGPEDPRGIVDLLVATGLVDSRSAARRAVAEGSVSVNNTKVTSEDWVGEATGALHGSLLVVRRGRRHMTGVELLHR